jgi:hypothetical protein
MLLTIAATKKGWTTLHKSCHCGDIMKMKLRTVIYSGKVEIDNVPIYSCTTCNRSEVFPEVKPDLSGLIAQLGAQPDKQTFLFNECNEWASILVDAKADKQQTDRTAFERLVEQRINKLLDLYLLAQTLNDEAWILDLKKRLEQISRRTLLT